MIKLRVRYTNAIIITTLYIIGLVFASFFKIPLYFSIITFIIAFLLSLRLKNLKILLFLLPFGIGIIIYSSPIKSIYYYKDINTFLGKKSIIKLKVTTQPLKNKKEYISFLAKIKEINGYKTKATIKVFSKVNKINYGDVLLVQGKIKKPESPDNFGEINYSLYYKRLKIAGCLFLNRKEQILLSIPLNRFSLIFIAWIVKQDIKNYIEKYYLKLQKGFLKAVLLGDRHFIPLKLKNIFINTGTIHILAISGLHIGIIMFIIFSLLRFFKLSKNYNLIVTLFVIIFYNIIIGYKASIIRATAMFTSFIICYLFDRDRDYLNALFIAALFILICNPDAIKKVSFQLSFLATAGIILFTPYIENLFKNTRIYSLKIGIYIIKLFSASIASQILILPVILINYKKFALISIIANLIAIPLITIILSISITGYIFFHILPFVTSALSALNNLLIAILVYILKSFSYIKPIYYPKPSVEFIIIYYILIFFIFYQKFINIPLLSRYIFYKANLQHILIGVLGLIVLSSFVFSSKKDIIMRNLSFNPEIIIFNINGRCIFIRTAGSKNILIDGGYKKDAIKHIIPFLQRNKVSQMDYIFLTSPLKERAKGLLLIIKKFNVKQIIDTGYPCEEYHYHRLIELITEKNIKYNIAHRGAQFNIDNLKILILNPPLSFFSRIDSTKVKKEDNIKNNSMVIKILWNNWKMLLGGDIKSRAIKFLSRNLCDKLKSNLVILPDINKNDFSIYRLIECVGPEIIVVNKKFTFFERYDKKFIKKVAKDYNAKLLFTQNDGAIKIYEKDGKIKYITSK